MSRNKKFNFFSHCVCLDTIRYTCSFTRRDNFLQKFQKLSFLNFQFHLPERGNCVLNRDWRDSNPQLPPWQGGALTIELQSLKKLFSIKIFRIKTHYLSTPSLSSLCVKSGGHRTPSRIYASLFLPWGWRLVEEPPCSFLRGSQATPLYADRGQRGGRTEWRAKKTLLFFKGKEMQLELKLNLDYLILTKWD